MSDKIKEVYNSLQERFKSPFILTFIIVWSIKHWRLLLIILNFNENQSTDFKTTQIENYIKSHSWTLFSIDLPNWIGMVIPVLIWSIISIITYYAITILSESIRIRYKRAKSYMMIKMNEKREVVTIEEFNSEFNKSTRLQMRYDSLLKKMNELNLQNESEKKDADSTLENLRNQVYFKTKELEKSKEHLEKRELEISTEKRELEFLKNTSRQEIEASTNKMKEIELENEKKIEFLKKSIDDLVKKTNLTAELLKNYDDDFTKSSNSNEIEILRNIFGPNKWEITKRVGDNTILEKVKLVNDYFLYDTGEILFFNHVRLIKKVVSFVLSKTKGNPTNLEKEAMNILDISNANLLNGITENANEIRYKRI